jgi:uncharacterized protein (TIGR04255 family)
MIDTPFGDEIPEVTLPHSPLIRVLTQVRFPPVASLANQDFIAPFQEKLRREYPILRKEQELGLMIGPAGAVSQPTNGVVWRLAQKEDSWRVSLGTSFLTLETNAYRNLPEFAERFVVALEALSELCHPAIYDRLGLRYINRIFGNDRLSRLPTLVRPELLGFIGVNASGATITSSVLQTQFEIEGVGLQVRAAQLPKDTTFDPVLMTSIAEPSWVLDLDAFTPKPQDFEVKQIAALLRNLAARCYRLFRWSITDQFVLECGGKP